MVEDNERAKLPFKGKEFISALKRVTAAHIFPVIPKFFSSLVGKNDFLYYIGPGS